MTTRARVRANGHRYRIDFGTNHEGLSVQRARGELDRSLQQVERCTWEPPSRENGTSAAVNTEETVNVTASRWWRRRKAELAPNTRPDYRWRLDHVLRHLAHDTMGRGGRRHRYSPAGGRSPAKGRAVGAV